MRDLINIITEASLTPAELAKHGGKYLEILIQFAGNKLPVSIDPAYRDKLGTHAQIDPNMIPELEQALKSNNVQAALPKQARVLINGKAVSVPWGALFKGEEFTGQAGKKSYNAGHLAELFMGLAVSAKFFNLGQDITAQQVLAMAGNAQASIPAKQKNYQFTLTRDIKYPEAGSKTDTLNFLARVPARSAEAFISQLQTGKFESDLEALLASSILYANESRGVATACQRVREDKNNNVIDVVSDGTTDAKGTKADLTLKVDGTKVNLLSLKTFSTETLGQISGIGFDQVSRWFETSFGINLDKYKSLFDETLDPEVRYKNIAGLYDKVIFPQIEALLDQQTPGKEAAIVKQLAKAANYFARGEAQEDVEIVKLDDKIKSGNYKILRFSDDLYDAMKHLDLEAKLIGGGQGRTIQIWVKPEPGEKVAKGANKLCQFRTQKMGDSYRNYFETGSMLEKLTQIENRAQAEKQTDQPGISRSDIKAAPEPVRTYGNEKTLGRKRQK
jgi:hypothetical protein